MKFSKSLRVFFLLILAVLPACQSGKLGHGEIHRVLSLEAQQSGGRVRLRMKNLGGVPIAFIRPSFLTFVGADLSDAGLPEGVIEIYLPPRVVASDLVVLEIGEQAEIDLGKMKNFGRYRANPYASLDAEAARLIRNRKALFLNDGEVLVKCLDSDSPSK